MKEIILRITAFLFALLIYYFLIMGIFKLITLCFDISFNWSIATGIWLILILVNAKITFEV